MANRRRLKTNVRTTNPPPRINDSQLPIHELPDRLRLETNQPNISGVLSDPLVFAVHARVRNGRRLPKDQASAMRHRVLSMSKSRRNKFRQFIVNRRPIENRCLGVLSFGDASISLPDEDKLKYPLLSDPNNVICSLWNLLWKEQLLILISCCGKGDLAVPKMQPLCHEGDAIYHERSFLASQRKFNDLFSVTVLGGSPPGCWQGPVPPAMLTMCGKAYNRIFYAENLYANEERPPSNTARFSVYDNEQIAYGESLSLSPETIYSLRSLLSTHISWVRSYRHSVDEIVRSNPDVHDARNIFSSPANRTTDGLILGDLPTTSRVAAYIFHEDQTAQRFRQVHTFLNTMTREDHVLCHLELRICTSGYPHCFFRMLDSQKAHGYRVKV